MDVLVHNVPVNSGCAGEDALCFPIRTRNAKLALICLSFGISPFSHAFEVWLGLFCPFTMFAKTSEYLADVEN